MKRLLPAILVFVCSGIAYAGMDCDLTLRRSTAYRQSEKIFSKKIRFDEKTHETTRACFHAGYAVLESALNVYCETGEDAALCKHAKALFWVRANADKDLWGNANATSFLLDACGMEELDVAGYKNISNNMRLCRFPKNPWKTFQLALEGELENHDFVHFAESR